MFEIVEWCYNSVLGSSSDDCLYGLPLVVTLFISVPLPIA